MSEPKDPLDRSISVEAALTENGVKASAKSRFLVALDRLLGGLVDIPGSYIDGKAQLRRLEDEIKRAQVKRSADLALEISSKLEILENAAIYTSRQDMLRKQLNREGVTIEALEELSQHPPEDDNPGTIDDDWLNVFGDYAARSSSERMRLLWGRILAGEVRKPGAFSLSTMRVLSEVDREVASMFQEYMVGILSYRFLIKEDGLQGEKLLNLTSLEEAGLLQDVNGSLGFDQTLDRNGVFLYQQGKMVLSVKGPPDHKFRISVIAISRAGRELMSILPQESDDIALRKIAQVIMPVATEVSLGFVTGKPTSDSITFVLCEKLK